MGLIITLADATFTNPTLPTFKRDSMLNDGTRFLFDFGDRFSWPKQTGSAINDSLVNLKETMPPATIKSALTFNASGGLNTVGPPGGAWPITAGTTHGPYLRSNAPTFVMAIWLKISSPVVNGGIMGLATYSPNVGEMLAVIDLGETGASPRAGASSTVAGAFATHGAINTGTVYQLGLSWEKNGADSIIKSWRDGAMVMASNITGNTLPNIDAAQFYIGCNGYGYGFPGSVYRAFLEDCTVSGRTPAEAIAADYAANAGRFS